MMTKSKILQEAITKYHKVNQQFNTLKKQKENLRITLLEALEGKHSISTNNLIVFASERINKKLDRELLASVLPDLNKYEIISTSKILLKNE